MIVLNTINMAYANEAVFILDEGGKTIDSIRAKNRAVEKSRDYNTLIDSIIDQYLSDLDGASSKVYSENPNPIIYYGDSRVVGMSMGGGNQIYIGKVSMGYEWMSGKGLNLLKNTMNEYPGSDVVFCFGINDMGNIDSYISFFQSFVEQYPDRNIYFESVNPVNDYAAARNGYHVRNKTVDEFNARLYEALPDYYIDTCSFLETNGFGTWDGVHYDAATYQEIQDLTRQVISSKI